MNNYEPSSSFFVNLPLGADSLGPSSLAVLSLKRWQTAAEVKAHRAAQAKYQKSPEQVQKRENRNTARRHLEKEGRVHKGDGKDVEHKDGNALNNSPMNWKAGSRHNNRSYKRTSKAHKQDPGS